MSASASDPLSDPGIAPITESATESVTDPAWVRFAPLAAGLLAVAGLLLRLPGALRYWLNGDEGIYYTIAHQDWDEASLAIASNAHPPLFYWIVRFIAALSDDHTALRWPSLLAGAASIFFAFALTRRLAARVESRPMAAVAGLVAALFVALSPAAIQMSQVVRPYALQSTLILGALLLLQRHEESGRRRDIIGYSIAMTAAMGVHYSSMLVFGAVGIVWGARILMGRVPRTHVRPLLLAQIPVVAVAAYTGYAHIAASLLGGELHDEAVRTWLQPFFLDSVFGTWPAFLGLGEYVAGLLSPFALLTIAGLGTCIAVAKTRAFGVAALVALVLAAVLSRLQLYPFGGTRHSFYLFVMLVPAIACGLVHVFALQKIAGGILVVALAGLAFADSSVQPWIGADPARPKPFRELQVETTKLDGLRTVLDRLAEQPGLIVMDTRTASSIAPFFPEAFRNKRRAKQLAFSTYGECTLVFADVWTLTAGPDQPGAQGHLLQVLLGIRDAMPPAEFERKGNDVRLLSCQGARLPNQITQLARAVSAPRPLLDAKDGYWSEDYSCARIDVRGFLAACQRIAGRGK